jgi:hypothetical protein
MSSRMSEEQLFLQLAQQAEYPDAGRSVASARLKARIYSSLVKRQQESGPLVSLTETKAAGERLCVFENLWTIAPIGEQMKSRNLCSVCHARLLAERMEKAPIYWSGCPYADFHKT